MVRLELINFLQTGQINGLKKGITRDKVLDILKQPVDWDADSKNWQSAKVWKYEDLQLWFAENTLIFIGIYPGSTIKLPTSISIEEDFPTAQTSRIQLLTALDNAKLNYQIDEKYGYKVIAEGMIEISFTDDRVYSLGTLF
jgi:hypothetical protein